MRLTIRINGSESATRHAFAVLWVDTDEGLWSREAHQGMDLPTCGKVRDVEGAMALCAADSGNAVCQLKGLSFDATQREQPRGARRQSPRRVATAGCRSLHERAGIPGIHFRRPIEIIDVIRLRFSGLFRFQRYSFRYSALTAPHFGAFSFSGLKK